ncbi:peptidase M20 domain-containing protein 2-like [Littorina saxatilis]|uniref:Peptidase M20 domain-containing protein 2 n=1 Tax=Littorina saxatilis TaxID=31220 RepID=A0AAN9BKI6_9CAEN
MAADLKQTACQEIDRCAGELNELSQQIWAKPELNFEEHDAHKVLTDYLEKKGFKVERHYKLDTAFRATWAGETSGGLPHVAVLCEYDALPEIGHACGHNLIAEAGVAAGLGVKAAMQAAGAPIGKLTVLGTPAEEGGGGKVQLIEQGAFTGMDVAMMTHPAPDHDTRPVCLAYSGITVRYFGKASHASGFPWKGVNALDAAVMCYQSVSNMRQQFLPTWRVHGIITKGGTKPNIIPDNTELDYYMRAPTDEELLTLKDKMVKCFEAAATATGCTLELVEDRVGYSNLVTNGPLADTYDSHARALGVTLGSAFQDKAGSTDMGNVSHVLPSLHPMYSLHTEAVNHTREFTTVSGSPEAQPYTLDQGKALAMTAIDVLTSPGLLAKIKADFEKNVKTH